MKPKTNARLEASDPTQLPTGSIVAIDDDPITLRFLQSQFQKFGYRLQTAQDAAAGLELITSDTSVALVDLRMPDLDGFACLRFIRQNFPQVQVIILTGSNETSDAIEAMRAGAFQFVTKPWETKQLQVFVGKAVEAWRAAHENNNLRELNSQNVPVQVAEPHGDVSELLKHQIARVAALDSTVFIDGESGTGKSTVARMIHQKSKRAKNPFVSINCASLPRDLLTSELFGHAKGAFTGADRDRAGHAEVADGGTLFLDEIGDLPLELQPKLLTFLQDRTIQRLGSSQVRKVDVRLIVATHRDLAEMCREHQFRQDLYFRLMVLSIELPPLRHRAKELPSLAEGILERICKRMGMGAKRLSESSMGVLLDHDWPGNIRELENVLERAAAFCNGDLIQPHDLILSHVALDRRARRAESPSAARTPASTNAGPNTEHCRSEGEEVVEAHRNPPAIRKTELPGNESGRDAEARTPHPACSLSRCECLAGKTLDEIERLAIVQTLQACRGNKAKSARMLGISEKSVYNKMRRLNIDNSDMSVGPIPSTATVPATQSIGAR